MLRSVPSVTIHNISRRVQRVQLVQTATPSFSARFFSGANSRVLATRRFYTMARPVGASSTLASSAWSSPAAAQGTSTLGSSAACYAQRRWQTTEAKTESAKTDAKAEEAGKTEGKPEGEGEAKAEDKKKDEGVLSAFTKLKDDIKAFPDIYNPANMLNMAIFTIFCLCSTGTEGEANWWVDFWGVDGKSFQPWAWIGHALVTNNFLAMTFAMILFHSLAHATMAQIGGRSLMAFCAAAAAGSGALMWLSEATVGPSLGLADEKQFGPWDVISALFVYQYLAAGTTPWGLMLSFNGWVKYANLVGAVCIVWYDPQPLLWGTLIGLALTKGKVFPPVTAAV